MWQNTIQHDHAEKFPWNHIFVNSVLKTLIWWKKCWIFRKNSDRVLDDFSTMWVFYSIFPYCTLTKEPYFQKSIWRKKLVWHWNFHYMYSSFFFLQKVPYRLQNQNIFSTIHEFINSYILVLVDPRVEGERVHSKLVVLIRRMKAGNNIGTYLQNLENNCGSVTNFKRREDSAL